MHYLHALKCTWIPLIYPIVAAMPQQACFRSVVYFVVHHARHKINFIRYAWSGVQANCYGDLGSP